MASKGIPSRGVNDKINFEDKEELRKFYRNSIYTENSYVYTVKFVDLEEERVNNFIHILDTFYKKHPKMHGIDLTDGLYIHIRTDSVDNYPYYEPHQSGYEVYTFIDSVDIVSMDKLKLKTFLEKFDKYLKDNWKDDIGINLLRNKEV